MTATALSGLRVLVIEDEVLIAMDIAAVLTEAGCDVIGPLNRVDEALQAIERERVDAAIMDINLNGATSLPVADALDERGTPFLFLTGYEADQIPPRHSFRPVLTKPWEPSVLLTELAAAVRGGGPLRTIHHRPVQPR
ncbi:MAG TPA: response regulator [Azospirillum sp.]|nr:response regulator [Azospirillum sp.]